MIELPPLTTGYGAPESSSGDPGRVETVAFSAESYWMKRREPLNVKVSGVNIAETGYMPLEELPVWLRTFSWPGLIITGLGRLRIIRFLYMWSVDQGAGHLRSLLLAGVLVLVGFMILLIGLVADLIDFNRQLIEMTLEKVRRLELGAMSPEEHGSESVQTVERSSSFALSMVGFLDTGGLRRLPCIGSARIRASEVARVGGVNCGLSGRCPFAAAFRPGRGVLETPHTRT